MNEADKAKDKRRALIVVNVQNDFCPGGALAVPHGDEVIGPLNGLIEEFLSLDEPVFKSRDWYPPKTKQVEDNGEITPTHCIQKTHGAEFHPELLDDPRITIISKGADDENNCSAFDGTDLPALLDEQGVKEIWVGGLATDYCVKNTVLDALRKGFTVKAIGNAMRAIDTQPGDGDRALEEMRQKGAEII
ncbi:MAG: isochorismatase family protein [Acidobacteria bacterium]|jgi:nicotinamidase/pyrazinamidase|nr:isochorismatase family protein [Acidobacteriota bacterium]